MTGIILLVTAAALVWADRRFGLSYLSILKSVRDQLTGSIGASVSDLLKNAERPYERTEWLLVF